ncbi:homeobox protein engrailed-2-like isoform X2 [Podarcis raffonei]|uniref:homeobox protein engrailed-2-like isoform X2 n=2 Tax=Lacertinae TaxID=162266 RepID=UPI002329271F|nr:homeobox protein engrailed-2-like isoform X2 [Podarcis raffonei]
MGGGRGYPHRNPQGGRGVGWRASPPPQSQSAEGGGGGGGGESTTHLPPRPRPAQLEGHARERGHASQTSCPTFLNSRLPGGAAAERAPSVRSEERAASGAAAASPLRGPCARHPPRAMSEPREKKAPAASPPGGTGKGPAVVSLLFSLLSVGACFLLNAKTSRLEGRLVALEEELAAGRAWSPGEQLGAEPLLALLQPQVDGLLQEKLSEGLAKLRTARDVSSECRCPPGPPGRRGKAGRRGDPGPPVSTWMLLLIMSQQS